MRQQENKIAETVTNRDTCATNPCQHLFSLKPRVLGLYFHEPSSLSFCPEYCRETRCIKQVTPKCYFDGKAHFPLFMLDIDRENSIKRQKQYLEAHKNRVLNMEASGKEILVPHPGQTKTTCFVCKASYTDYRKHIITKKHKKKLNSSRMEQSIRQLIGIVSKQYSSSEKEDILNTCSSQYSRMVSSKTEDSQTNVFPVRKSSKEIKSKQIDVLRSQLGYSQLLYLKQLGDIQIKVEGSLNKGEDNRTTTINFISPNSEFRVQDYLI